MKSSNLAAVLMVVAGTANASLQPGDVAFTAFNADEDGFALAALRELPAYTTLYFSDNEWSGGAPGTGTFNTGENTFAWVTGAQAIAPGTVVRFSAIDQATRAASVGAFGLFQGGTPGFSASGDTIFAFTGDAEAAPTRFLAALSSEAYAGSSLTGSGLVAGVTAVAVGNGADFAEYAGPRAGLASYAAYADILNDAAQWHSYASGDFAGTVPNLEPFAIAPVPEPGTYALLSTGLALLGWRLFGRGRQRAPWPLRDAGRACAR